jgi:glycosyltransferase involved in cell wall biosynthesis
MKKIFAVLTTQNDDDIIESFCRYNLTFCDGMIIYECQSSDNTNEIIRKLIAEGLPIHIYDDPTIVLGPFAEGNVTTAMAYRAINEYGADLVVPLDTDKFLYHTDGINPRETLEALREDVEYQVPLRTYVYEKEPDIELGFMPNNFTQYRNPALEEIQEHTGITFISKDLIHEKKEQSHIGSQWLMYLDGINSSISIENPKKLVCAHFPIRSKGQLIKKIILNWIYHRHKSSEFLCHSFDGLYQLDLLLKELKDNGELSQEKMRDCCIDYSLYNTENNLGKDELEKIKKELGDNLLINDKLKLSFCTDKLILHYTKYEEYNKSFIRTITTQIEKTVVYLTTEIDEKSKLLGKIKEEQDVLLNSRSWRITKPLRDFTIFVRQHQTMRLFAKGLWSIKGYGLKQTLKRVKNYWNVNYYWKQKSQKKIKRKYDTSSLTSFIKTIKILGGFIFGKRILDKWGADNSDKNVLLISHELSLTGAPMALYYFAENLKAKGYHPIILSPTDGSLRTLFLENELPVLIYDIILTLDLVLKYKKCFQFLIVNTLSSGPAIMKLNGTSIPIFWWIHESFASYSAVKDLPLPKYLNDNIHIYCVGSYAAAALKQFRPYYNIETFLYYNPDYVKSLPQKNLFRIKFAEEKCIFTVIGTQEERKGHDILIQAIRLLSLEQLKKCLFIFVGRKCSIPIMQNIIQLLKEHPQNIQFIEELNRENILSLYQQIDCLICSSKDDPMPIVVTEAMIMSKIIICSENTGSAKLLKEMKAGLIYRNNSLEELSMLIQFVLENRFNLSQMREQARKVYECYFSQDMFNNSVNVILQKLCNEQQKILQQNDKIVSVIIPTYNAGNEFRALINILKNQIGIGKVEIIIIDSGSSDGTAELAEELGTTVLRITQEDFSHSYARNLGARNANGEYLLFMTQDALPPDNIWINCLMQPLLKNDVVAVSCKEIPKPGCDLFGRISIWSNNEYMGILQSDRILYFPDKIDHDSIRKNAQLTNVTNLIRKDIFIQFLYQGNYAEDLDLGIRLIQSGYRLSLLSFVHVIHSHTRPAIYYLKRSIVNCLALKRILPDYPIQEIDAQTLVNRIITAYCITNYIVNYLIKTCDKNESLPKFCKRIQRYYNHVLSILHNMTLNELKELAEKNTNIFDSEIIIFIKELLNNYNITSVDPAILIDQLYFIINIMPNYLNSGAEVFNKDFKKEISGFFIKLFGVMTGPHLAYYHHIYSNEKNILNEIIIDYAKGI